MDQLTVYAPSRLHFGLLSWGAAVRREFGGVGLMIDKPGLTITGVPDASWIAFGPLADRVLAVANRVAATLNEQAVVVPPLRFSVVHAPPEHVGLGLGTQLALAVARCIREFAGLESLPAQQLAQLAGRGLRSGIGLHGFGQGGLIVDGGRVRGPAALPAPLLARLVFPHHWSILVLIPPNLIGLHGSSEVQAFGQVPPLAASVVDHLCRLVLLDLLPAVIEHNLAEFGAALQEIQSLVGQGFAPAQGGIFARPELADLVEFLRSEGLVGVGQSSWGPTLYGFSAESTSVQAALLGRILHHTGWPPGSAFWTSASQTGARIVAR